MGTFEIHRRVRTYLLLVLLCWALAAGFAWCFYDLSEPLLVVPSALLFFLGTVLVPALAEPRTPLFVADDHGVRMRNGDGWVGLLWSEMGEIRVEDRDGWRYDARVKVVSVDGRRVYWTPVGASTTVSVAEARRQLASRRDAGAY